MFGALFEEPNMHIIFKGFLPTRRFKKEF